MREWKNSKYLPFVIVTLYTAVLLFFLLIGNVKESKYDLESFQLSPDTIRSVKTMEDAEKTEQERKKAEHQKCHRFINFKTKPRLTKLQLVNSIFDSVLRRKR